jgi:predicted dienelactone hydrolase
MVLHRSGTVVDLPRPSGPYAVGRVEDTATDSARRGRRLSIWTWYPAVAGTGQPAIYAPDGWQSLAIGLPLGQTRLDRVRDRALEAASPVAGRFLTVVLAPGLGFSAPQYAALAEDLASRGYIVVGVTPTGSANVTVLDGQVAGPTTAGNPPDFNGEQSQHDQAIAQRLLDTWVPDLRFAADTAARLPGSTRLAEHVVSGAVTYVGHSFGGTSALAVCHVDRRCRAAVDLDGALYGPVARDGLKVPVLLVQHDGSCIAAACTAEDATDHTDVAAAQRFISASTGLVRRETIAGSGHLDFTDDGLYYWALPLRQFLGLGDTGGRHVLERTAATIDETLNR